jgi:hypothetical protein
LGQPSATVSTTIGVFGSSCESDIELGSVTLIDDRGWLHSAGNRDRARTVKEDMATSRWQSFTGIVLVAAGCVVASACGPGVEHDPQAGLPRSEVSATSTAAPPSSPAATTAAVVPVGVVGVFDEIEFYPACGNETLEHQDTWWYPIFQVGYEPMDASLAPRVDAVLSIEREPSPVVGRHGLVRVANPGPGDDSGTLVVWADGVARWVSDSADLDVWMTTEPIDYNWVC